MVKEELGYIPVIISNIYDGKDFGETNHYSESENLTANMIDSLNRQKYTCTALEMSHIMLINKKKISKKMNQSL